jgi:large subunit ribosomal protein L34e
MNEISLENMSAPNKKSGRFRKVFVRTPGGRTRLHYKKKKPSKAKCAQCGALLKGVARARASRLKDIPKTKKRPERPYPNLCSRCARERIKQEKIYSQNKKDDKK